MTNSKPTLLLQIVSPMELFLLISYLDTENS
jgi:hypothetical protein